MAMHKSHNVSGHKPGGGYSSAQHKDVGYQHGQVREAVNRAGVAQIGQRQGNHVTERGHEPTNNTGVPIFSGGRGYPSELGNTRAATCTPGPGGGRTIYKSGSQS